MQRTETTLWSETAPQPNALDRLARHLVRRTLSSLREGRLRVVDGTAVYTYGRPTPDFPGEITLNVRDPAAWRDVAFGGSIGAGEAYMLGRIEVDDLTGLVRLFVRNRDALLTMERGWAYLQRPLNRVLHLLRRNTRAGAQRNIAAHYDLGNDFFAHFLDARLMYSCAVFPEADASLEAASTHKLERVCRKLALQAGDHVLEIGSGWGGFALYAAQHYGCRVTTTTISAEQYAYVRERVAAEGLADRITVLQQDYRALTGTYDKLVSIEMVEAVGHAYLGGFFAACDRLLKPEGMMLLQAITIADQFHDRARRSVDFIQRYIFPGGELPSVATLTHQVARRTDMRLFHLEDIGPHYARTLQHWRQRVRANRAAIRGMGYPETFLRMWEFYLCYCEGGFLERSIGTVQMLLTKPLCRRAALVPVLA